MSKQHDAIYPRPSETAIALMTGSISQDEVLSTKVLALVSKELPGITIDTARFWVSQNGHKHRGLTVEDTSVTEGITTFTIELHVLDGDTVHRLNVLYDSYGTV